MTCTDSGAARARLDQGTKTYDKLNHKLSHRTRDKTAHRDKRALHVYLTRRSMPTCDDKGVFNDDDDTYGGCDMDLVSGFGLVSSDL